MDEAALRAGIVAACRKLADAGLCPGTSGNVSARLGQRAVLITPSGTPYDRLEPAMLAVMELDGEGWTGPLRPSSEWRFHRDILAARPEVGAVVHGHPPYGTALAMARKGIPAAHYMVAAFGGADVRCGGYARFGTQALSGAALAALEGRTACLLANHGTIALGETLERAVWRAEELETLARQYWLSLQIGGPVVLDGAEIAGVIEAFRGYGQPGSR